MCRQCWGDNGTPANWTPQIAQALELVRGLYVEHVTGGPLHVHVDDWNIDGRLEPYWPGEEDQATIDLCNQIAVLFNGMSIDDRMSVLAYHHKYIEVPT